MLGGYRAGRDATRPNRRFIECDNLDRNYSDEEGCGQLLVERVQAPHFTSVLGFALTGADEAS